MDDAAALPYGPPGWMERLPAWLVSLLDRTATGRREKAFEDLDLATALYAEQITGGTSWVHALRRGLLPDHVLGCYRYRVARIEILDRFADLLGRVLCGEIPAEEIDFDTLVDLLRAFATVLHENLHAIGPADEATMTRVWCSSSQPWQQLVDEGIAELVTARHLGGLLQTIGIDHLLPAITTIPYQPNYLPYVEAMAVLLDGLSARSGAAAAELEREWVIGRSQAVTACVAAAAQAAGPPLLPQQLDAVMEAFSEPLQTLHGEWREEHAHATARQWLVHGDDVARTALAAMDQAIVSAR